MLQQARNVWTTSHQRRYDVMYDAASTLMLRFNKSNVLAGKKYTFYAVVLV